MNELIADAENILDAIDGLLFKFQDYRTRGEEFDRGNAMFVIRHLVKAFDHVHSAQNDICYEMDLQEKSGE